MALAADRQRCAHLLRRFGLGASEPELELYSAEGIEAAVDRLLNYENVDEGFTFDVESLKSPKGRLSPQSVALWWTLRLLTTRRPLQERMTLFWHGHFATSASKVSGARLMLQQNQMLRTNVVGSFRDLLTAMSKDPAMILWLDNEENIKGHANENFAREVMELFTLGLGHFTEKDVQESARAFTGWTIQRSSVDPDSDAEFVYRPVRHDDGPKTFLGQDADYDGDGILRALCDQSRTAEYIATKIWDWFVWPKPDPATVAPFAQRFHANDLDLKMLLHDIMTSEEFYSPKAQRAIVKDPPGFCIATLRQMGVGDRIRGALANPPKPAAGKPMQMDPMAGFDRGTLLPAIAASRGMRAMGMTLLYPPDVHGWENGTAWISSQTMMERVDWGDRIFGQSKTGPNLHDPVAPLFQSDRSPEGVVRRLIALFDAPMKPDHLPILVEEARKASGGSIDEQNAAATAAAVTRLIFASPEFQLC